MVREIKKRDYVQIEVRDDLEVGKHYDGITYLEYMHHMLEAKKFIGKLVETIIQEDGRKIYVVWFNNKLIHWYLSEKMIVRIIEIENEWD